MKTIPINVVYAVWSGLGTASIAVVGWIFFREALTGWGVVGIAMIVGGVAVLHTAGASQRGPEASESVTPASAAEERF
jgi:multidrug transporter EmrE-like cation transporter